MSFFVIFEIHEQGFSAYAYAIAMMSQLDHEYARATLWQFSAALADAAGMHKY